VPLEFPPPPPEPPLKPLTEGPDPPPPPAADVIVEKTEFEPGVPVPVEHVRPAPPPPTVIGKADFEIKSPELQVG
jgi:hypothetical protein